MYTEALQDYKQGTTTVKGKVLSWLKQSVRYRERKNKNLGHVHYLLKYYPQLREIDKNILASFGRDFSRIDRNWRYHLEHDENLRGTDYSDKEWLSHEKKKRLGYVSPIIPTRKVNSLDEI